MSKSGLQRLCQLCAGALACALPLKLARALAPALARAIARAVVRSVERAVVRAREYISLFLKWWRIFVLLLPVHAFSKAGYTAIWPYDRRSY